MLRNVTKVLDQGMAVMSHHNADQPGLFVSVTLAWETGRYIMGRSIFLLLFLSARVIVCPASPSCARAGQVLPPLA
jgi:hypothetical protein